MEKKIRKAQTLTCVCGACFAACVEPMCYTDKDWLKSLRKYVKEGAKVEVIPCADFRLEQCTCKPKEIGTNQISLAL